jgi:hypothetical protein
MVEQTAKVVHNFSAMQFRCASCGFLHSKTSSTNIALQDANKETYGVPVARGGIIPGLTIEDADAVYRDWQSKSVEILGEAGDMSADRMFPAKDPDGNYIQVYHLYPQVQGLQKQMGLQGFTSLLLPAHLQVQYVCLVHATTGRGESKCL